MSLQLVQIDLDWSRVLQQSHQLRAGTDPGYHLHAWLAGTFGPGILQPFRWVDQRGVLYGYGAEGSEELVQRAERFAEPRARSAIRSIASKALPVDWPSGTRVGFALRMTPTVRLSSAVEGRAGKGSEVDAYLAAQWRSPDVDRATTYRDWLTDQLQRHGDAKLEAFRIEKHGLARMVRRRQNGKRRAVSVTLPDVECTGVLRVTDGERFGELLKRGVGRHRAFGFGMLLLRPPPR